MNQVVIGASIPFLVGLIVYAFKRGRPPLIFLAAWPLAMAAGSLWAVLPDIPRLLGNQKLYLRLLDDPRTNIFFFHYTIDRTETDTPWWIPVFLLMALAVWLIAWIELRRREGQKTTKNHTPERGHSS
jgi:hypothetical protein